MTLLTAPKGPNSCHSTLSSESGDRLYTKMHQPVPVCPGMFMPTRLVMLSMVMGENLGEGGEREGGEREGEGERADKTEERRQGSAHSSETLME